MISSLSICNCLIIFCVFYIITYKNRQLLNEYDLSNVQYNLLYSIYAFPNMILPAISGVLSDKIGYDWLVIFFFGLMVLAQGIFVFGCYLSGSFAVLLTARLVFGIGAESHALVETPLIYDYFKGKELAFALALHLSMARAGSSVNDICTYLAYTNFDGSTNDKIVFATSIGLFILAFFWICIIIMILVHRVKVKRKKLLARLLRRKKRKEKKRKARGDFGAEPSLESNDLSSMKPAAYDEASISNIDQISKQSLIAPLIPTDHLENDLQKDINAIDHTLESANSSQVSVNVNKSNPNSVVSNRNINVNDNIGGIQNNSNNNDDTQSDISKGTSMSEMKLSDIKEFDLVFWLLTWNCAIMYAIVLSWMNIGSDFLQETYGYTHGEANAILTIPYSLAGVLQPIWGWISDKIGFRSQFLLISSFIFVMAHYMLGWIRVDGNPIYVPIIALTLLGFGYSIFTAVIWPCFPLVVPPRAIGTAYGIPTSGYNLILTIYYVLVGVFTSSIDNSNKYKNVQYFLLLTSMSTVLTSLWLMYKDKRTGWRLYPSAFADPPANNNDDDDDANGNENGTKE